jgi:hypothetical protein
MATDRIDKDDKQRSYETRLLKEIKASVSSIDSKVDEILDTLREYPRSHYSNDYGWNDREWYSEDENGL